MTRAESNSPLLVVAPDTYGAIKGPGRAGTSYVPEHWVVGADGNYFSLWHADECEYTIAFTNVPADPF